MLCFSEVCQRLESVPFHRDKAEILARYLESASNEDGAWALYLLLGGVVPRILHPSLLERWILEESKLPAWLLQECREAAGDFAETVALLGELSRQASDDAAPKTSAPDTNEEPTLAHWIESRLLPALKLSEAELETTVRAWWREQPLGVSWVLHALAIGRFPVRVSRRIAQDAFAAVYGSALDDGTSLDANLARLTELTTRLAPPPTLSEPRYSGRASSERERERPGGPQLDLFRP